MPSIEHYIVVDPAQRVALHYRRNGDLLMQLEHPVEGVLGIDPPEFEAIKNRRRP